MEDNQEALNAEVEETTNQDSPTENQTTDGETEVSTQPPVVPKKGAQSRIRELAGENRSLKDRIAELTSPVGLGGSQLPYTPQNQPVVSDDGSIDAQEFKRQVLIEAHQLVNFETQRAAAVERINRESAEVVQKFPELDPESDHFDKDLSDAIYEAVEAKVKSDPTSSVKDFVSKQMRMFKREAQREEAQTAAEITKQAAQSAIRPTQNKPVDTKFEDLSLEEMRQKLGYAQ